MDSTASLYCLWNVTLLLQAVEDLSCGMCDASLAFTCNTQTRQNYEAVLRRLQQGSCAFVQQEAHTRNVCPLGLRAAAAAEKLCLKRGDLAAISHGPHYNCTTEASPARATLLSLALLDTVLLPAALLLAVLLPVACRLLFCRVKSSHSQSCYVHLFGHEYSRQRDAYPTPPHQGDTARKELAEKASRAFWDPAMSNGRRSILLQASLPADSHCGTK